MESEEWGCAKELAYQSYKSALVAPHTEWLANSNEIKQELVVKKACGYYGSIQGCFSTEQWIVMAEARHDNIVNHVTHHFNQSYYPCVYTATMKTEWVPITKILTRKQRMYMVQCKEMVVLHKHFFSKQSKRIRKYREIAHGQTWFYGHVNALARLLENTQVQSEDDDMWDKYFVFMASVYELRTRAMRDSGLHLTENQQFILNKVVEAMRKVIVILPTGDIVQLVDRVNPSGSDATTENNCIARVILECYMQILYYKHIEKPFSESNVTKSKIGTKYLGDDRIASSRSFEPGYLEFYAENLHLTNVRLKIAKITDGPVGAEFAGFTIAKSHWDPSIYVPLYKLDKINAGLFVSHDTNFDITCSRLMAFAFLLYPHYSIWKELQPIVVAFLQQRMEGEIAQAAIHFWTSEMFLRHMWSGQESSVQVNRLKRYLTPLLQAEVGGILNCDAERYASATSSTCTY